MAGIAWAFVLPGIILVHRVTAPWSIAVRLLVGAAVGMLTMSMICFCVAWALGTYISAKLVLAVATLVNVSLFAANFLPLRNGLRQQHP
jgi:hypothetical protein